MDDEAVATLGVTSTLVPVSAVSSSAKPAARMPVFLFMAKPPGSAYQNRSGSGSETLPHSRTGSRLPCTVATQLGGFRARPCQPAGAVSPVLTPYRSVVAAGSGRLL